MPDQGVAFGAWLKRELASREWNQSEFAARVGTSVSVVSRWVNGKAVPEPQSVDLIADVLGLDYDDVLAVAGHRPRDEDEPDEAKAALLSMLRRLRLDPDGDREAFLRAVMQRWIEQDARALRRPA